MIRYVIRYLAFLLALPLWAANTLSIPQTTAPITFNRAFVCGEIANFPRPVVNGTPATTWQADVKTRCPGGSVQTAIISLPPNTAAGGPITVGFQNNGSTNSGGSALTEAQMLTFDSSNWDATLAATFAGNCSGYGASGTTCTVDPRNLISDDISAGKTCGATGARCAYWLAGPVVTQVILRGPGDDPAHIFDYDFGTDVNHSLHPMFVVTLYAGMSSAKIEYVLENMWTTKLQDQPYTLNLRAGAPSLSVVYTKSNYNHYAESRWRKTFWTGATPGAININHNLAYLTSTNVFPNWDLSITVPGSSVTADVNAFNASDKGDLGGSCLFDKTMGGTGGRPDIGLQPAWYVRGLFTFDAGEAALMAGCSEVAAYIPIHLRESATGKFYDSGHTVNAQGLPVSLDARPTYNQVGQPCNSDCITPIGSVSTNSWIYDMAHVPAIAYTPYMLSGDYYLLEELQFFAHYTLVVGDPNFVFYGRGGSFGIVPYSLQTRGEAWGLRDVFEATFITPDSTATKTYLTQKVSNNIQAREGYQNITNGSFPPANPACPGGPNSDIWCYGHLTIGESKSNPLNFVDHGDPYGGGCWAGGSGSNPLIQSGPFVCDYGDAPWMINFYLSSFAHAQELGFPAASLNRIQFRNLLHQLQDPAYNPWLSGVYKMPVHRNSTQTYFQTWGDVLQGFNPTATCPPGPINWQTISFWSTCDGGSSDSDYGNPGYPHIMKGTASYLVGFNVSDGALTGTNAWNWAVAHVAEANPGINPQWEVLPRGPASCSISPSSLPSGTVGTSYGTQTLTANNCGIGTLTWSLIAGSLPPGLSGCNSVTGTTCAITGTPSTATGSPFAFTIRVTDGSTNTATQAYSLTVSTGGTAPVITTATPLPGGTINVPYSTPLAATGTTPITWSVLSGALCPGLSLNASTGAIGSTPTSATTCSFTIQAANSIGTGSKLFSLTIAGVSTYSVTINGAVVLSGTFVSGP